MQEKFGISTGVRARVLMKPIVDQAGEKCKYVHVAPP